jgi:hypothetical protein
MSCMFELYYRGVFMAREKTEFESNDAACAHAAADGGHNVLVI